VPSCDTHCGFEASLRTLSTFRVPAMPRYGTPSPIQICVRYIERSHLSTLYSVTT